jgi:K+-transporting ATPase ATPase C chain
MIKELGPGLRFTLVFTIFLGLVYPVAITGVAQLIFPSQANGSLVSVDGKAVGSSRIAQAFTRPEYFHPRPSAAGSGYDGASSAGSNLGPTSRKLVDRVKTSAEEFRKKNPEFEGNIPADILTTSSSGLDPHISPAAAGAQAPRVAKARGVSADQVRQLIAQYTEEADLGLLGEPGVNVLMLNIALDQQFPAPKGSRKNNLAFSSGRS